MVIYRGSGVLNFAHGAIGMVGAYVEWEVKVKHDQPSVAWPGLAGSGHARCSAALIHLLIMRQLRRASPLARIVATLGMLIVLQSRRRAPLRRDGSRPCRSELPVNLIHPFGITSRSTGSSCVGIAASLTRRRCGCSTGTPGSAWRRPRWPRTSGPPSSVGLSPDWIATANWALGSALAGVAAILIAPIVQLQVATMTNLVLAALAAALVAGFRSFPIAFVAGMVHRHRADRARPATSTRPGVASSLPFVVIVVWMILRGQALPLRDYFLQRLPAVGSGRVPPGSLVVAMAITSLVIVRRCRRDGRTRSSPRSPWASCCSRSSSSPATPGSSRSASSRWPGSARWSPAGSSTPRAGRSCRRFSPASLATVPLGALFAIPAVRARGINLAIVTLGLGTAIELMIFHNGDFVGGFAGTEDRPARPVRLGHQRHHAPWPLRHRLHGASSWSSRSMVASMRRGRSGRRLLAVRTNERAAAALGHQRARREDLRLRRVGRHRRGGRHPAGIPQGRRHLRLRVHQLHVDPRRRLVVHRRHRLPARSDVRLARWRPARSARQSTNAIFWGIRHYIPLIGGVSWSCSCCRTRTASPRSRSTRSQGSVGKIAKRSRAWLPAREPERFVLPPEQRERVAPTHARGRGPDRALRRRHRRRRRVFTVRPGRSSVSSGRTAPARRR